jgi:pimeloyl-ACP methyl ester carboxylesterase
LDFILEDKAAFLQSILLKEGVESPVLIGQSMGGYVSQMYMEKYPDDAAGFISIDSCPIKRQYYSWWELALLKRTYWMYMSIPWKWLVKWGSSGTATTGYGRKLMKSFMDSYDKKEYCQLADHGYKMLADAVDAGYDYDIKCPALLICGERDMAGSAKRYNEQWTKIDGYPLVWLKDAGHNANTDKPEDVNRLIEEFVEGLK